MTTQADTHIEARTEAHDGGEFVHAHVAPASLFGKVLLALLVLTILTVAVAQVHFGSLNLLIAMGIAAVKASLVMTYFMHLKWDTPVNQIAILSSFLFLSLLFVFILSDYATRGATDELLQTPAPVTPHPWFKGIPGAGEGG